MQRIHSPLLGHAWLIRAWITCLVFLSATAANAQPLTANPGSPFLFDSALGSSVTLLSPDETHLFVTNQWSNAVTVLDVAADGSLTLHGTYATSGFPVKLATNPAGTVLYVVGYGVISVFSVAADGTASAIQTVYRSTDGNAEGVSYVPLAGGDFLYLNNNAETNTVSAFRVNADGTLGGETDFPTGGHGGFAFWGAPSAVTSGGNLYVVNGGSFNNTGSNDISVFAIGADGSLSLISGSPFALPAGEATSGALAVDPAGTALYAGLQSGHLAKYTIAANGSLASLGAFHVGDCNNWVGPDGLAVSPDGAFVVAAIPHYGSDGQDVIAVVNTATMTRVQGSPVNADPVLGIEGVVFNHAGTQLFVGYNSGINTNVSVYQFTSEPDLVDLLPPTTTMHQLVSPYDHCNPWISFTVTDPDSESCQVSRVYRLDGGAIQPGEGSFQVSLLVSHSLEFWSVDAAGHEELPHNLVTLESDDVLPPSTFLWVNGIQNGSGWYRSLKLALYPSDPDSCEPSISYYKIDGGVVQTSVLNSTFQTGDGIHTVEYWSVDPAGNEELPHQTASFKSDDTPPAVTLAVSQKKVNGKPVATVSGKITDAASGIASGSTFTVFDEYGLIHPSGPVTIKADGTYSFTVALDAPAARDKDGRTFEFTVTAVDVAGNTRSKTVLLFVTK